MPALTEAEARKRAGLVTVDSYDVSLDLTVTPVRSRTRIRFRCGDPGAETFAELTGAIGTADGGAGGAALNGASLDPPADGRLRLTGLAAENDLVVEFDVPERVLTRFTDPSDGAEYLLAFAYPTGAPDLFCCFDQPDMLAEVTLSLRAPAGWTCIASGAAVERPPAGEAGTWQFTPVRMRPADFSFAAGAFRLMPVPQGTGDRSKVVLASYGRSAMTQTAAGHLARYCELAGDALVRYERVLGVSCPFPKYDIVAFPDVPYRAATIAGMMIVGEDLLGRLADPDDDFARMIAAHEVAHLWFGCMVGVGWWDDLWLEESLATYVSYHDDAGWAAFSFAEKLRFLRADQLPTTEPLSSPVATMAQATERPNAITYLKGTAIVRQLAALIGDAAVTKGLADYLTKFAEVGTGCLDDLLACWSAASGRDLASWADEWLRSTGVPILSAQLTETPDGKIAALAIAQDLPRTHRIAVALYDWADIAAGARPRLWHRRTVPVEWTGTTTSVPGLAGEPVPAAIIPNAGDRALAQVTLDEGSLAALSEVGFDLGDPLTEAACWSAAWYMVLSGKLAPADYAALVARRLTISSEEGYEDLQPAAAEALLTRAVICANRYLQAAGREEARELIAGAALRAATRPFVTTAMQLVLLAGFAASAQSAAQLGEVRALLDAASARADAASARAELGALADVAADLTVRAALVRALATRGLAEDSDLDALTAADRVSGEALRATAAAGCPDPEAKENAWIAALARDTSQRMGRAHAEGFWVPGQEQLLVGYRDRYFTEALPELNARDAADARGDRVARRLALLLYPAMFPDEVTLAATSAAINRSGTGSMTRRVRTILLEQEAELHTAIAIRTPSEA